MSSGREFAFKTIAQAILAYAISVFRIPIGICDNIQIAIARFWWGSKGSQISVHWARQHKLCKSKGK